MRPGIVPRVNQVDLVTARYIPFATALVAFVLYLVTLDTWISFTNVYSMAQVRGWNWNPLQTNPLHFFATLPLKLLPVKWCGVIANLMSAVFAAVTVALVSLSIALIPVENPVEAPLMSRPQLDKPRFVWLGQILGAGLLAFQLTFWTHATSDTGFMVNVLILAAVLYLIVRAATELQKTRFLYASAFLMGLGMGNYWGTIGFLPIYLVAVLWIRRTAFFAPPFLVRMALLGLAGFGAVLLMPIINALVGLSEASLGTTIWQTLVGVKNSLIFAFQLMYWGRRDVTMVLVLVTMLPILVMCIRWRTLLSDTSKLGASFSNFMLHAVHLFLLLVLVLVMFDPPFSPRIASEAFGGMFQFLGLYMLVAIAIGYFAKYGVYLYHVKPEERLGSVQRRIEFFARLRKIITATTLSMACLAIPLLLVRNFLIIRGEHLDLVPQFYVRQAQCLPKTNSIVFLNDLTHTFLLRGAIDHIREKGYQVAVVHAPSLEDIHYRMRLRKQHGGLFATLPLETNQFAVWRTLMDWLANVCSNTPVWYGEHNFGYFYEVTYPVPHGLVHRLHNLSAEEVTPPPLDPALISANMDFWKRLDAEYVTRLSRLVSAITNPPTSKGTLESIVGILWPRTRVSRSALYMGMTVSKALNYWGVVLQRHGQLEAAKWCFERAIELNPFNVAAVANLETNHKLQAKEPVELTISSTLLRGLEMYRELHHLLVRNGPLDHPWLSHQVGIHFWGGGLLRQAAQYLIRVTELVPNQPLVYANLAQLYNALGLTNRSLSLISKLKTDPGLKEALGDQQHIIPELEVQTALAVGDVVHAEGILKDALARMPHNISLLSLGVNFYISTGAFSNAVELVDRLLTIQPTNVNAVINKGYLLSQMGQPERALAYYSQALVIQPDNFEARVNRAVTYLQLGRLEEAEADYKRLEEIYPDAPQAKLGLAEIAIRRGMTNTAISYLKIYLSNVPPGSQEAEWGLQRLRDLAGKQ